MSNSFFEPCFDLDPDDASVKVGEKACITCEFSGKPKPNIFWRDPHGRVCLPTERSDWFEEDGRAAFIVCSDVTLCACAW